jgi:hypothetical protein
MRLVFVHGINNQDNTIERIKEDWWNALSSAWAKIGLPAKPMPQIDVAFYADKLAEAERGNLAKAITMGGESPQGRTVATGVLQEYIDAAGVTQEEINRVAAAYGVPVEAVQQGAPHEGWIISLAGILERILPTKGKYIARLFLKQAALYVENEGLRESIDAKVKTQIISGKQDPAIVIAHSLGTVVAYRLLANQMQSGRDVPLFLTLGSPLSVKMFKKILPPRGSLPTPPIKNWLNGRHREDFVTLGRAITEESIGFAGVTDEVDIVNDVDDKHSIKHYLASPDIARAVHAAL